MPNQKQDTPVSDIGKAATRQESNRAHPFHTTYDCHLIHCQRPVLNWHCPLFLDVSQGSTTFSWKRVEVNDSVKIWVMFKSGTANSIWVPLTSVSWGWSAIAIKQTDGTWIKSNESSPGPTAISNLVFPIWDKNVASLSYVPE